MSDVVHGKNVHVEIKLSGIWYKVLCGIDCSFTRTPEIIEKTSADSGIFREFAIRREEWEITVSGLTKVLEDTDVIVYFFYMLNTSVRRQEQTMRISFDDGTNDIQISGQVLIGQESISGNVNDFANCSINLKGTGAFEMDVIEPPVLVATNVFSDWWDFDNVGDIVIGSLPSAIHGYQLSDPGITVLDVSRKGDDHDIILTGTPANRQVLYDGTQLTFDASLPNEGFPDDTVFVVFKTS